MTEKEQVHRIRIPGWLWREAQERWGVEDPTPQLKEWLEKKYPPGKARPAKEASSKIANRIGVSGELDSAMRGRRSTIWVDCDVATAATAVERPSQHGIFGVF